MKKGLRDAERQDPLPASASGEAWRRAERFGRKLDETGDTPRSFVVKGAIGRATIAAVALIALWLIIALVRSLVG